MPLLAKLKKAFVPPDPKAALNAPPGVTRTKVWLDVSIANAEPGRIEIELFDDITPKTAENFKELCTSKHTLQGQPAGYKNSFFHRVVPGFMIQGGDFINGNGTGVFSIYGGAFADENFQVKHSVSGLLSMANTGPNTNGCQFFITVAPADFLDGKHVVFGRVLTGMPVVKAVEGTPTGAADKPINPVRIVDCGVHPPSGVPGPQDELATTEGGAAGRDPSATGTGTSAAPASHNFEGTGAPVDFSGAPIERDDEPATGSGLGAAGVGAGVGAGAGAAGLAAHHNQQQGQAGVGGNQAALGAGNNAGLGAGNNAGVGSAAGTGAPTQAEMFHDAVEDHPPGGQATGQVPGSGGYSSGQALDPSVSRHDPLDPRSDRGGYAGGAGVAPVQTGGSAQSGGAFASAAVDYASPNLRDNVQGDVMARSPEAGAPVHSGGARGGHHGGGGLKGLYRRLSKQDEK